MDFEKMCKFEQGSILDRDLQLWGQDGPLTCRGPRWTFCGHLQLNLVHLGLIESPQCHIALHVESSFSKLSQ